MGDESPFRETVLKGKVALITRGGSDICFEIASQFGLHGARVAIMGRRKQGLEAAVASFRSLSIQAVGIGRCAQGSRCQSCCGDIVGNELGRLLMALVHGDSTDLVHRLRVICRGRSKRCWTTTQFQDLGFINLPHPSALQTSSWRRTGLFGKRQSWATSLFVKDLDSIDKMWEIVNLSRMRIFFLL